MFGKVKEGIVLIGVEHSRENRPLTLPKVKELITKHGSQGMIIGIERDEYRSVQEANRYFKKKGISGKALAFAMDAVKDIGVSNYFNKLENYAKERGLKVVQIDSTSAYEFTTRRFAVDVCNVLAAQLNGKITEMQKDALMDGIIRKQRYASAILNRKRDKFMVERIKQKKPDIVVVGEHHAKYIAKKIPIKYRATIVVSRTPVVHRIISRLFVLHRNLTAKRERAQRRRVKAMAK